MLLTSADSSYCFWATQVSQLLPRVETRASTERQLHWQDGGLLLFFIADEKSDFL